MTLEKRQGICAQKKKVCLLRGHTDDQVRSQGDLMQSFRPPEQSSQRPPEICSSFPRTRDDATFFRADSQISVAVVLDIFICFAHSLCVIPSKSTSLRTSNSSTVRTIASSPPASSGEGLWEGTKILKAGIWQMRRLLCGLANGHLLILLALFFIAQDSRMSLETWQ